MTPKSIKKNTYASEKRFLDLLVLWDCYSSTLKEEERSRVANVPKMSSAQCRGKTHANKNFIINYKLELNRQNKFQRGRGDENY